MSQFCDNSIFESFRKKERTYRTNKRYISYKLKENDLQHIKE